MAEPVKGSNRSSFMIMGWLWNMVMRHLKVSNVNIPQINNTFQTYQYHLYNPYHTFFLLFYLLLITIIKYAYVTGIFPSNEAKIRVLIFFYEKKKKKNLLRQVNVLNMDNCVVNCLIFFIDFIVHCC